MSEKIKESQAILKKKARAVLDVHLSMFDNHTFAYIKDISYSNRSGVESSRCMDFTVVIVHGDKEYTCSEKVVHNEFTTSTIRLGPNSDDLE